MSVFSAVEREKPPLLLARENRDFPMQFFALPGRETHGGYSPQSDFRGEPRATKLDDLLSHADGNSICRKAGSRRRRLLVSSARPAMTADDDFDSQTRLPITRGW